MFLGFLCNQHCGRLQQTSPMLLWSHTKKMCLFGCTPLFLFVSSLHFFLSFCFCSCLISFKLFTPALQFESAWQIADFLLTTPRPQLNVSFAAPTLHDPFIHPGELRKRVKPFLDCSSVVKCFFLTSRPQSRWHFCTSLSICLFHLRDDHRVRRFRLLVFLGKTCRLSFDLLSQSFGQIFTVHKCHRVWKVDLDLPRSFF